MAHSELSPSDSARWSRCPGSINFTRALREDRSSEFAAEGTVAHTIREQCLVFGFDAYDFVGQKMHADGFEFSVDEEMADNIQPGIDQINEYEGKLFVETWVDTTKWLGLDSNGKRQGGSLDALKCGSKLFVQSDLKFGMGVAVQAVENTQQIIYAAAAWEQFGKHISDATEFLIIIDQPRHAAGGGQWRISLEELMNRAEALKVAAAKTRDPNAPLTPGDKQCTWCPAANVLGRPGGCPAHHEWMMDQIDLDFEKLQELDDVGLDWTPPQFMTREARSHLVRVRGQIEKWLEKLHADELDALMTEGPAFGYKAVLGRNGKRVHRDEDRSRAWMKARGLSDDQLFTKKLISPTQGEKALRLGTNKFPKSLIEQGAPKPVIVPVEDDRPSIATVDDKFDEV